MIFCFPPSPLYVALWCQLVLLMYFIVLLPILVLFKLIVGTWAAEVTEFTAEFTA